MGDCWETVGRPLKGFGEATLIPLVAVGKPKCGFGLFGALVDSVAVGGFGKAQMLCLILVCGLGGFGVMALWLCCYVALWLCGLDGQYRYAPRVFVLWLRWQAFPQRRESAVPCVFLHNLQGKCANTAPKQLGIWRYWG